MVIPSFIISAFWPVISHKIMILFLLMNFVLCKSPSRHVRIDYMHCIIQKSHSTEKCHTKTYPSFFFVPVKDFSWEKHCRVMMTMISLALLFYSFFPEKLFLHIQKNLLYERSMFPVFLSTSELAVNFWKDRWDWDDEKA